MPSRETKHARMARTSEFSWCSRSRLVINRSHPPTPSISPPIYRYVRGALVS